MFQILFWIGLFSVGIDSIGIIGITKDKPILPTPIIKVPELIASSSSIPIDLPITKNVTTSSLHEITGNDKESPLVYDFLDNLQLPEINIPNLPCNDDQCIGNALTSFIRLFPNGNPLLKVPSIEPFFIKRFDLIDERNDENGDGYRVRIICTDLKFYGFGNSTITTKGFQSVLNANNVTINIFTPKIYVHSDYDMIMKFHGRKIHGKGHFLWDFDDFDFIINFKPKVLAKSKELGTENFLNFDNFNLDYVARKVVLKFDDLFDGDTEASEREHTYLNEHIPEFFNELRYAATSEWKSIFLHLLTPIFENNSIDGIFQLSNLI